MELNRLHQILVYDYDANLLGKNINIMKKTTVF
jgi:hypothetical protein